MSEDHPVHSPTPDRSPAPNIEVIRERAVEVLMEHFANDVMDLDEFERLLDAVNACSTVAELRELLSKLPPLEKLATLEKLAPLEPSRPATHMMPARGGGPVVVDADRVRDHGFMISVLGGTNRAGRWIPARKTFALGILGGTTLDFREALLGPGITDLSVLALLSGVEIIVPPEMTVEVDGMALCGGFTHETDEPLRSNPDLPTLRVRGLVVLGNVNVEVRLPGETPRQAKKRRRLEQKGLQPRLMSRPDD